MAGSRVLNSMRNLLAAWGGQACSVVLSFVVRAVFVAVLAQEYVGLETLFSSILTILALADLGIGSAIVFALYEPLAKDDVETIKSLMRLFKRCYVTIGCTIIAIGMVLAPFVRNFVGEGAPDIPNLELYFFCFVLNTGISYFFSYKGSLLTADQKSYIVYLCTYGVQILLSVVQIIFLLVTHNYLLYLVFMVLATLLQNALAAHIATKKYPYLKDKNVQPLPKELLNSIVKNVFGLVIHKVAGVCSVPVSNLVITSFINLATTSIYGNYLMITNALTRIVDRAFDSIIASVGNLSAEESEERQYEVFKTTFFINAVVYACISGGLLCSFNAFIEYCWIGADWLFPSEVVIAIVLMFYVKGMRSAGLTFTSAYGLYWFTKWKAVLEAFTIPVLSVLLVRPFGIIGVFAASIISSVCVSTIYEAWAVYRHGFHRPLRQFALQYVIYAVSGIGSVAAAFVICEILPVTGILAFLVKGFIGVGVPFALYMLLFGRTRECKECAGIFARFGGKIASKLLPKKGK